MKIKCGVYNIGTVIHQYVVTVRLPYNSLPTLLFHQVHYTHLFVRFQFFFEMFLESFLGLFFGYWNKSYALINTHILKKRDNTYLRNKAGFEPAPHENRTRYHFIICRIFSFFWVCELHFINLKILCMYLCSYTLLCLK